MVEKKRYLEIYERLLMTRALDELMIRLFREGNIPGFVHSGIGQEAITTGALLDVREDDYMMMHHRGFGYQYNKGMSLEKVVAEMCGRVTGYSSGKGGFHMADPEKGVLGIGGSVGTCFPFSVGAGMTAQHNKRGQVVLCFFGEGTANREVAGSSYNLAALWKLPIIFICENNRWALTVPFEKSTATPSIAVRAEAYGMPGEIIDGNDVLLVNETINKAIARARAGEGPSLIECLTFRWQSHAEGYPYFGAEKDAEEGRRNCPIERFRKVLAGVAGEDEIQETEKRVPKRMQEVYDYAVNSPWPEPESAYESLYAGGIVR